MIDDTDLVFAARGGDRDAFGQLVDRWFDRCWAVAWRVLHDRDLAADVAQDTLLTAWRQLDRLDRASSFGGWVLRIARNRSLDRFERERRAVPTADDRALERPDDETPEAVHARTEQRDLVWAAAAALGERDASLLDLHLRHGLEPHEVAEELGIAPNAAHQAMFRLRKRMEAAIRAWVVWRNADPSCPDLRAELAATPAAFDATTVRTITAHARGCEACAAEHDRVGAPSAMFAAVPLAVPPTALRTRAVRALRDAGVPTPPDPVPDETTAIPTQGPSAADETTAIPVHDATSTMPVGGPPMGPSTSTGGQPEPDRRRRAAVLTLLLLLGGLLGWGGWAWWQSSTPVVPIVAEDDATEIPTTPPATEAPSAVPTGHETPEPTPTVTTPSPTPRDDPTTPPPTPTPTPTPTETATATPTEPTAPAPVIHGFEVVPVGECSTPGERLFDLVWRSEHADEASITGPDGTSRRVEPTGTTTWCAPRDVTATFTLEVVGPGGTATETRTADEAVRMSSRRPGLAAPSSGSRTPSRRWADQAEATSLAGRNASSRTHSA